MSGPFNDDSRPMMPASRSPHLVVLAVLLAGCLIGGPAPARGAGVATSTRPNHLLGQTSPYLLQHLYNPVDWYPWSDEALERARREDRPIFLSVGYSACHWCHVMEREAFSDEEIAGLLGESFVAIKVDREERPDLDEIYMTAVQAMTGGGGWPMSVFLTPDLKPFYGGTYFPKDRFRDLLVELASAWKKRRGEVLAAATRIHAGIERQQSIAAPAQSPAAGREWLDGAVSAFRASYDADHGGFGGAPKFPPHGALAILLEANRQRGDRGALDMAVKTLDAMARGGLYDQIGGGFHRYATDAGWLVPHFEKMLYDNALLVPVYLEGWRRSGRRDFRRVAEETLAWVAREMTDPRGGFYASLDADSEDEEGRFYLWTAAQVRLAVDMADADLAIDYFDVARGRARAPGRGILHVPVPLGEFARRRGGAEAAVGDRLEAARQRLLLARAGRVRPHLDDKVLTSWNGLMISAYARAYAATGDERYRAAAERAARFVLSDLRDGDGGLLAVWRQGRAKLPGYLDDSAFVARGLLDLHGATSEAPWLDAAEQIVRAAARFRDPQDGGYYFTPPDRRDLIVRTRGFQDGMLPSGNAVMAECLARLGNLRPDAGYREEATRILALAAPGVRVAPAAHAYMILAAQRLTGDGGAPPAVRARAAPPSAGLVPSALAADAAGAPGKAAAADSVIQGTVVGRANVQRVVDAAVTVPSTAVRPGQSVTLSVRLDIHEGWHVNSATPSLEYLIPTRVEFTDPAAAAVEQVAYPEGRMVTLEFAKESLSVYEGTVTIRATIRPPSDSPQGLREVPARLTYQACSNKACLPPETVAFAIPLRVAGDPVAANARPAPGPADGPGVGAAAASAGGGVAARREGRQLAALMAERGLLFVLGAVFLAGLALNLTPCVYPMIPVTIGFFSNQAAGGGWGRRVALPSLYVLGMALTYSALGLVAGLTGGMFGSALQSRWVTGSLVILFVAMALWLFGVYELRMPAALTRFGGGRRGPAGAFLMGLTMGIVAAPCIGPFVVGLLAFVGASGDPVLGFWLFFVLAVGMGLPNLVLGVFSGALASLPRSGVWLIYAKKVMGIAMLAVAIYFLQPFLPDRALGILVLAFAAAAGIYLGLLDRTRFTSLWFRPLKLAVGLLVVASGAWLALPLVSARGEPRWAPYTPEAIARARADSRPVVIDFYADWCLPCREIDRNTFSDPRVLEETERFALLKADLTSFESQPVRDLRERFEVIGVPTIVFIDGGGTELRDLRLYGFEPPEAFVERLRRVR
jgi:hypothetical protein